MATTHLLIIYMLEAACTNILCTVHSKLSRETLFHFTRILACPCNQTGFLIPENLWIHSIHATNIHSKVMLT